MKGRTDDRRTTFAQSTVWGRSNGPASSQQKRWQQHQQGNLRFHANFESGNIGDVSQRIPSSQVLYYRSPKGPRNRMAYVMSFLFQFDGAGDAPYYFAYAFPYTYTDLQRYLYSLERLRLPFLRREALCRTLQRRRVELLTITAPEGEPAGGRPLRDRKWVFVSARVHPGETPAQFIVHGMIDFLTGASPRARALRANVVFKIVPMLNPDGVVNGNYRCSYLGFDLNRHWLEPSAWAQPEILSVKDLVTKLHEDPSVDLDFYVDIHAHSVGTNSFMYGNNTPTRPRKEPMPRSETPSSQSTSEATTTSTPPTREQPPPREYRGGIKADITTGDPSPRPTLATTSREPTPASNMAAATPARSREREWPLDTQFCDKGSSEISRTNSGAGTDGERGGAAINSSTRRCPAGRGSREGGGQGTEDEEDGHALGEFRDAFPRMLADNAPDFSFARSRFDADPSKEGTGRRALGQLLSPDVSCFTLEVSFYASRRDNVGLVPYTMDGYVELGRSLASTFVDYYGLTDSGTSVPCP